MWVDINLLVSYLESHSLLLTVVAPIMKAMKSVSEVIVIEQPWKTVMLTCLDIEIIVIVRCPWKINIGILTE